MTPQKGKDKWRVDPYTKNDPKLMAKAGYLSYGPFDFGTLAADKVTSKDVAARRGARSSRRVARAAAKSARTPSERKRS